MVKIRKVVFDGLPEHAALYFTPSGDIQPILSSHFLLDIQLQYKKIIFLLIKFFMKFFLFYHLGLFGIILFICMSALGLLTLSFTPGAVPCLEYRAHTILSYCLQANNRFTANSPTQED